MGGSRCIIAAVNMERRGYIGLGSNLGDRLQNLQRGVDLMIATPDLEVRRVSPVYAAPPWGYRSEHEYLNAVAEVSWPGPPLELVNQTYRIEAACGRHEHGPEREGGYHDRTLDLDLLWLDGIESSDERLVLPHPRAHERAFVLRPWHDLAPRLVFRGRTLTGWLAQLPAEEAEAVRLVEGARLRLHEE